MGSINIRIWEELVICVDKFKLVTVTRALSVLLPFSLVVGTFDDVVRMQRGPSAKESQQLLSCKK